MRCPCPRLLCSLALALTLGSAPLVRAQDEAPDPIRAPIPDETEPAFPEAIAAPPPDVEAIEITGERLDDANVQDEAQAITAFTGADLDRANIVSVDSLQFNVPGLHVGQSANAPIITLRGIGTENSSLTGEPGVAFHVDGINFARPSAARVAFFDLETLDVKRGPQGLLGGKNSTSGSINLVTRKPTDEFEVSGDVLSGNYDRIRLRGALNVPMGEFVAARFAMYQETRDGFLDNKLVSTSKDPFDVDDFGLRGHLRMTPTDTFELLATYNYYKQDGNGPQADVVPIAHRHNCVISGSVSIDSLTGLQLLSTPVRDSVLPYSVACYGYRGIPGRIISTRPYVQEYLDPYTNKAIKGIDPRNGREVYGNRVFDPQRQEDADPRSIYAGTQSSQQNRFWGWTTSADWDVPLLPVLGETHLKLLGGFQQTEQVFSQDFDASIVPLSAYSLDPDSADQYSAEAQWGGTSFGERVDWQASLFWLHEEADRHVAAPSLVPASPDETGGLLSDQTTDNSAYGAALHSGWQLTDVLRFNLGGRLIKDRKSTNLLRTNLGVNGSARNRGCRGDLGEGPPAGPPIVSEDCEDTFRGRMWGSGIEWRPFGDDHMLYARLDRGYKSGGFRAGTVGRFDPEKIWAYAAGTKSEFFDQRLRINLEAFFYNYDALQLVILDGLSLRTENTDAKMYGWDLEALASPIDGLNLSAVVAFLKTRTSEYYSLDPTLEAPSTAVDANAFRSWHGQRLVLRDEAESAAEAGLTGDVANYATRWCKTSPSDSSPVQCGLIPGTVGGLDDYSDNHLSRAPRWKVTLAGDYEIPLGRFGSLTPRVQYTWQDDTYFRAFNRDFDLQEDYHLTDAKVTWNSPEARWSVEAFVQNIEDEAAKQNILIGPREYGAPPFAWYNPPRFYGVQVGFKY
jgi:outer membrane receptor protein involved in Fe transport